MARQGFGARVAAGAARAGDAALRFLGLRRNLFFPGGKKGAGGGRRGAAPRGKAGGAGGKES